MYISNLLIKGYILLMHICVYYKVLNMDSPYVLHHGGVFITHSNTHVKYVRETKSWVLYVDLDTFAVFDMSKCAKNLGVTDVAEFFNRFLEWNFIMAYIH